MVSWSTIKTLLFTFGPLLLPRLISYYRSLRPSHRPPHLSIRPLPRLTQWSLHLLFLSSLFHLLSSLPQFQPENVFHLTHSRITTSTELLFRRLAALKPSSPIHESIKSHFTSTEARAYYLSLGPDPLLHCEFCTPDDTNSYLYFALPSILAYHVFHIGVLALVTSAAIFGAEPARWRTQAVIAGAFLGAMEIYMRLTHDLRGSIALATRIPMEPEAWHWRVLTYRGIALAVIDAGLGWMIYLSATNRAFLKPVTVEERLLELGRKWEGTNSKIHALGITRNTIQEKKELGDAVLRHWEAAREVTGRALREEEEVKRYMKAVEARWDMRGVVAEAERYAEGLVEGARRMLNVDGNVDGNGEDGVADGQLPPSTAGDDDDNNGDDDENEEDDNTDANAGRDQDEVGRDEVVLENLSSSTPIVEDNLGTT